MEEAEKEQKSIKWMSHLRFSLEKNDAEQHQLQQQQHIYLHCTLVFVVCCLKMSFYIDRRVIEQSVIRVKRLSRRNQSQEKWITK